MFVHLSVFSLSQFHRLRGNCAKSGETWLTPDSFSVTYFAYPWNILEENEVASFLWMEISSVRWLKFMCFPKNFLLSNPQSGAACHSEAFLPRLLPKEGAQFCSHWRYWDGFFVSCEVLKFVCGWCCFLHSTLICSSWQPRGGRLRAAWWDGD